MPEILWPPELSIREFSHSQHEPGRLESTPVFGGPSRVRSRGYAIWRGNCILNPAKQADGGAIAAFLAEMSARHDNWCEMPVPGLPTIEESASVAALGATGNLATLQSSPDGIERGAWFRSGSRSWVVESWAGSSLQLQWMPHAPLAAGDRLDPLRSIRVRLADPAVPTTQYGVIRPGPVSWIEYPW